MKQKLLILICALVMVIGAQAKVHKTKQEFEKACTTQMLRAKTQITGITKAMKEGRRTADYTYGAWEKFKDGTCSFTYSLIWEEAWTSEGLPIYARTSNEDPNIRQFKIENWQSYDDGEGGGSEGLDLIIDYDASTGLCHVQEVYADYEDEDYGKVYAADFSKFEFEGYEYENYPCTFDTITGHFSLYLVYYDKSDSDPENCVWNLGEETADVDGYPDFTFAMGIGNCTETNNVGQQTFNLTLGEDIAAVKYITLDEKWIFPEETDSIFRANLISGEYPMTNVTSESFVLSMPNQGYYTVIAGCFNEDGTCIYTVSQVVRFSPASNWKLLGTFEFTDDALISSYGYDPETYEVEVYENTVTPRLFRLKNPYGAAHPYNEEGYYTEDHYLEVHAEDSTCVYIDYQPLGVDWGYGESYIYSEAANMLDMGYTLAEIKVEGAGGSYSNGVITFPVGSLYLIDNDGIYQANANGEFTIYTKEPPAPTPGQNLVKNGDFETWTTDALATGWGGWQATEKGNTGNATTSKSEDAHGGNYAVYVQGSTSNVRLGSEKISLAKGKYNVQFYAKAAEDACTIKPGYAYLQASGSITYNYGAYANEGIALTTSWKKCSFSFELKEKTDVSMVIMNYKKSGDCIIDDFSLTLEGDTVPTPIGGEIYSIDFTQGQGEWEIYNDELPTGVTYIWKQDSQYGMKANAYISKVRYEVESWIVSPQINCGNKDVTITVNHALNYCTTPEEYLGVYYSTDMENWTELQLSQWPAGNSWTFEEATVTIQKAGKIYLGFQYTSDTDVCPTWEIKNVTVTAPDAINDIQTSTIVGNGNFYNLAGQKVDANYRGIVIINGKKVLR